jgi:acetyl-CoA synthase
VEFVDGSAPGFAAIVGAAPDPEIAKMIVEDYQKRNLYIFCAAKHNGISVIDQLLEAGVQIGWNTRIVPFGPDISSAVFALGLCQPRGHGLRRGAARRLQDGSSSTTRIVSLPLSTPWAMSAPNGVWRRPAVSTGASRPLADTDIPEILPTGICTYEHVVANVPHEEMVQKSVEVRGLKVTVSEIDIPCAFGPAFEGERVRGADLFCQMGGGKTQCTELVKMAEMKEIEDGKVDRHRSGYPDMKEGRNLPLGIYVQIAGREFQADFEPILERQIHHLINYIQGIMHIGQRDISWMRISKGAVEKGFTLKDIGVVLHAKLHQDFGKILDKVQVTLYTKKGCGQADRAARAEYKKRTSASKT